MHWVEALRCPLSEDLSGFLGLLRRLQVPCRVYEAVGEQVLLVPESLVDSVRELYQRQPQGGDSVDWPSLRAAKVPLSRQVWAHWQQTPVTLSFVLLVVLVGLLTHLGDDLSQVRWLSFLDFRIQGNSAYFATLGQMLAEGQWWRLISPILLHFGILHLAMNGLWFWELGRRIEEVQGPWVLLVLVLMLGMLSNLAQYALGGPGIFGGLSGVLYGLLGYCTLYQRQVSVAAYRLPPGVAGLMLVWLLVCLSGLVDFLSMGALAIANAAHVSGLLVGALSGFLAGRYARRSVR